MLSFLRRVRPVLRRLVSYRKRRRLRELLSREIGSPIVLPTNASMLLSEDLIQHVARTASRRASILHPPHRVVAALRELTKRVESVGRRRIPIQEFTGLSAAKNQDFGSLERFGDHALYPGGGDIRFDTKTDLDANMRNVLAQIGPHPWTAVLRAWDGRLFWSNSGGAHHFAAMHRQDREQGRSLDLDCKEDVLVLRERVVESLRAYAPMFFVSSRTAGELVQTIRECDSNVDPNQIAPFNPFVVREKDADTEMEIVTLPPEQWYADIVTQYLRSHDALACDFSRVLEEARVSQDGVLAARDWQCYSRE